VHYRVHYKHYRLQRQQHELAAAAAASRQTVSANSSENSKQKLSILTRGCFPCAFVEPTGRKSYDERLLVQAHREVIAARDMLLFKTRDMVLFDQLHVHLHPTQ
jgi:hypothetical protein